MYDQYTMGINEKDKIQWMPQQHLFKCAKGWLTCIAYEAFMTGNTTGQNLHLNTLSQE